MPLTGKAITQKIADLTGTNDKDFHKLSLSSAKLQLGRIAQINKMCNNQLLN
jgi:hypothetical protein